MLQLKEGNRDIKKSLADYVINAWNVNISPKYMTCNELNGKFETLDSTIAKHYEEYLVHSFDYKADRQNIVWRDEFHKYMEDYATKKSLKVMESMMSLLPTTEMLHESTFAIE